MKTTENSGPSTGSPPLAESPETQVVPPIVEVAGTSAASSALDEKTVIHPREIAPEGILIPESKASAPFLPAIPRGLADLSVPGNQDSIIAGSTTTQKASRAPSYSPTSLLSHAIKQTWSFLVHTVRHDWLAAPISFLASLSSNLITAFAVVACAPWCAKFTGGQDTHAFSLAISTTAVLIGYAAYLAMYYPMMAYKEKAACRAANKPFNGKEFLHVVAVDFTGHLPYDLFTMGGAGAAQLALLESGFSNLFWSVIFSQMAIDLLYSPKEALYWSGSKALVKKLNGERSEASSNALNPANQDSVELKEIAQQAGNQSH